MKPKLTLRDLFWPVLVVAVCCGWWSNRKQLISDATGLHNDWRARHRLIYEAAENANLKIVSCDNGDGTYRLEFVPIEPTQKTSNR